MPADFCAVDLFAHASPMCETSARMLARRLGLPADSIEEFTERLHTAGVELFVELMPTEALALAA